MSSTGHHNWKFLSASFATHTFKGDLNHSGETLNILFLCWRGFSTLFFYSSISKANPKIKQSAHLKHRVVLHMVYLRSSPLVQFFIQVSFNFFWLESKRIPNKVYAALLSVYQGQVSCSGKPQITQGRNISTCHHPELLPSQLPKGKQDCNISAFLLPYKWPHHKSVLF